jgi:hypothetical protein
VPELSRGNCMSDAGTVDGDTPRGITGGVGMTIDDDVVGGVVNRLRRAEGQLA